MQIDAKQQHWHGQQQEQQRAALRRYNVRRTMATAALPTATAAGGGQASLVQFSFFFLNLQHANQTYQSS